MGDLRVALVHGRFSHSVFITVSCGEVALLSRECVADENGAWEGFEDGFTVPFGARVRVHAMWKEASSCRDSVVVEYDAFPGENWVVLGDASELGRLCFVATTCRGALLNTSFGSSSGYISNVSKESVSDEEVLGSPEPLSQSVEDVCVDMSEIGVQQSTNNRFQELMDILASPTEDVDLVKLYEELQIIAQDFVDMATHYGHIIISEMHLPEARKSIKPVAMGGALGGVKYVVHDIMFKVPVAGVFSDYPDPFWASMKVAGHELKGLKCLSSRLTDRGEQLVHLPLTALIDSRGYRLVASSVLPIDRSTLVYGSDNAGDKCKVVASDRVLAAALTEACKSLNLKEHGVVNDVSYDARTDVVIASPVDLEGHRGRDWRYYVVDFSRLMPPLWMERRQSNDQYWSLYSLMRSEFVSQALKPLNVDAFSRFASASSAADLEAVRRDQQDIKNASSFLLTQHLQRVADELWSYWKLTTRYLGSFPLTQWVQSRGINVRFLGLLFEKAHERLLQQWIGLEAVARVGKNMLRAKLRESHRKARKLGSSHLIATTISFCSAFVGIVDERSWWTCNGAAVVEKMQSWYNFCDSNAVGAVRLFLRECIPLSESLNVTARSFVLERICEMTGITLDHEVLQGLRKGTTGFKGSMLLLGTHDIKFGNRVKHLNLIDYARALILYHQGLSAKCVDAKRGYLRRAQNVLLGTLNSSLPDARGFVLAGEICLRRLVVAEHVEAAEADALKVQAAEFFQQAIALDSKNVSAMCSLAQVKTFYCDTTGAENLFQKALCLDEQSEDVLLKYAIFCKNVLKHEEGFQEMMNRLGIVRQNKLATRPLVDDDFLAETDAEFKRIVIEGWVKDTWCQMEELLELCRVENWNRVVDVAHSIKGSAAQIGAVRVSFAADKAYLAARDDPPCNFSILDTVTLLREAFEATSQELRLSS